MKFPTNQKETQDYINELEDKFESLLTEYEASYHTKNEMLLTVLTNQLELEVPWERLMNKLYSLNQFVEYERDQAYAGAINRGMTEADRMMKFQEAKVVAEIDPTYRIWRSLGIQVDHLYRDARGIRETITSRRYVLNNITNAVVASVERTIV